MADGTLVFFKPHTAAGKLVFGDDGGGSVVTPAELQIDAEFAHDRALPSLRLAVVRHMGIDAAVANDDALPELQLWWDANVSRVTHSDLRTHWKQAESAPSASLRAHWQEAQPARHGVHAHWQAARPVQHGLRTHWQESERVRDAVQARWQEAKPLRGAMGQRWQEAERLRASLLARWQEAEHLRGAVGLRWQETLRLRGAMAAPWGDAEPRRAALAFGYGGALPVRVDLRVRWQEAMRPRSGVSKRTGRPQPQYYDQDRLGRLVFIEPWTGTGKLVFTDQRAGGGLLPAVIYIPRRRTYIVNNSIACNRVVGGEKIPVVAGSFTMELDYQSWTWAFSFTTIAEVLPLLRPGPDRLPRELELVVNGVPYRMRVQQISRSVQHPRAMLRVSGGSNAVMLGDPYALEQSFTQPLGRTAAQMMDEVLTINEVSIGWTVDFQLTDWPVPAGTWAFHGTWISAICDIASAVGGYVQPHNTDDVLRVLPRWPVRSWELDSAVPDIELPPGIAVIEATEWPSRPVYEAIYMHGMPGDKLYHRYRDGFAGDLLAPMATHALLVHNDAANQRAIAELSEGGDQVIQDLTTMVLPDTGIIVPGKLVRYTDDEAATRTGIVRGVSVADDAEAALRQTIKLESRL